MTKSSSGRGGFSQSISGRVCVSGGGKVSDKKIKHIQTTARVKLKGYYQQTDMKRKHCKRCHLKTDSHTRSPAMLISVRDDMNTQRTTFILQYHKCSV